MAGPTAALLGVQKADVMAATSDAQLASWMDVLMAVLTAESWAAQMDGRWAAASDCLKVVHWGATMAALLVVNLGELWATSKGVPMADWTGNRTADRLAGL